ncbi:MAG: hypothetical protein Q8O33_14450 [Pseudomonadota bacterium]|nr:hypothetical protein [Pseudomonadota bacterium]
MFDTGLSIGLTLQLGAFTDADTGPARVRVRFSAAWGTTEVFVSNTTLWDLTRVKAWRHETGWTLHFASTHRMPYGLRLERGNRAPYGDMRQHRRRMAMSYGDAHQHRLRVVLPYGDVQRLLARMGLPYGEVSMLRRRHLALYSDLGACRKSMRFPYWLTQAVAARHVMGYAVTDVNPVAKRLTTSWSLLADQHLQAVMNTPELVWQDRTIRLLQATLSCDEDSPVWIATVEIAQLADFAAIAIGDPITLQLGLEIFELVVDGKTMSRESQTSQRCELTAISPLALLDAPFAATTRYYQPGAVSAHTAVEELIGNVDWQLPDWTIPAGRLLMEGVTPLAAARSVVAAIGGIVESNPDGTVVCRRRHAVSIPDYGKAPVAHQLFDADVLASRARIAPARGYNRVTLANEDGASGSSADRIEYVADADDANQGTVRAYLAAMRPVLLTHTGHPATVIAATGEVMRSESEVVEFIEGRASTRYPVTAITSATWRHSELGAVTADGQSLVAAVLGYSLLDLTYTTTSLDWCVTLATDEEVQFILVDV